MGSSHFEGIIGKPINTENCDSFVDSLNDSPDYLRKVFGKVGVARYNCNAFFFQLVAARILEFQWRGDEIIFAIARDDADKHKHKTVTNWEGYEFRTAQRGSNVPWSKIVSS